MDIFDKLFVSLFPTEIQYTNVPNFGKELWNGFYKNKRLSHAQAKFQRQGMSVSLSKEEMRRGNFFCTNFYKCIFHVSLLMYPGFPENSSFVVRSFHQHSLSIPKYSYPWEPVLGNTLYINRKQLCPINSPPLPFLFLNLWNCLIDWLIYYNCWLVGWLDGWLQFVRWATKLEY